MEDRNARAVLAEVQHCLNCPKGQYNKFGGFAYRSLEDINSALKPICTELRCGYAFADVLERIGERYYLRATATFWAEGCSDVVSVTAYAREQDSKKGMDEAQITGLASSYARKYAACGLFAIDSGEEVDAMPRQEPQRTRSAQNKPKQAPAPAQDKTPAQIEPASAEQNNAIAERCATYGRLRGKTSAEVLDALTKTRGLAAMGVKPGQQGFDAMQAAHALSILDSWISKAE